MRMILCFAHVSNFKEEARKDKQLTLKREDQAPATNTHSFKASLATSSEPYLGPHDGFDSSFKLFRVIVVDSPHVWLPDEVFSIRVLGGHLNRSRMSWFLQSLPEWLLSTTHSHRSRGAAGSGTGTLGLTHCTKICAGKRLP